MGTDEHSLDGVILMLTVAGVGWPGRLLPVTSALRLGDTRPLAVLFYQLWATLRVRSAEVVPGKGELGMAGGRAGTALSKLGKS